MTTPSYNKNPDGSWMDFDQIVFDLYSKLTNDDIKTLALMSEDDVRALHHGWGMGIRNAYGLWDATHVLTANWFANPDQHDMRDGADYSKDHPDQLSNEIMVAVWNKVKEIAS